MSADPFPPRRPDVDAAFKKGNYKDAYDGYRRLALDAKDDPNQVGHDLLQGIQALRALGRVDEAESVVESFGEEDNRPRKLVVVDRTLTPDVLEHLVAVVARLGLTIARVPDLTQLRPGTEDKPELQPISVEDLLGRVDSKFTLVSLAAMRGRQINSYFNQLGEGLGSIVPPQVTSISRKPLSISLEEIAVGKITYTRDLIDAAEGEEPVEEGQ